MSNYWIQANDLDLTLCVTSGQVFRWHVIGEAEWLGVDGPNWYHVCRSEHTMPDAEDRVADEPFGPFSRHLSPITQLAIESNATAGAFRSLFRLDDNLAHIKQTIIQRGPELAGPIERLPGLRLMRPSSMHETLFCFLCTSNNNLSRITSMVRKLGEYGESLAEDEGHRLKVFPSVERIAEITEEELRTAGFGYRAKSIPNAARQLLSKGKGWLESLKATPYPEARKELLTLDGVGPKLADCMALYGLGKMDAVPVDTHLWQAICRNYFPEWKDKPLTDARYRAGVEFMRNRFGELAGLAHLYLYLDNMISRQIHSR